LGHSVVGPLILLPKWLSLSAGFLWPITYFFIGGGEAMGMLVVLVLVLEMVAVVSVAFVTGMVVAAVLAASAMVVRAGAGSTCVTACGGWGGV
jgi:hypothetical protein